MAVGFEFQLARWKVYRDAAGKEKFPKGSVLFRTKEGGWMMVADDDDVEFVVDHVEDDAAAAVLEGRLRDLCSFVQEMESVRQKNLAGTTMTMRSFSAKWVHIWERAQLFYSRSSGQPPDWAEFRIDVPQTSRRESIQAIPQATAGLRLDRIEAMLKVAGNDRSGLHKMLVRNGAWGADMRACVLDDVSDPRWRGHTASPALRGLLALVLFYMDQGSRTTRENVLRAAKYMVPIMSRTSFGAMFAALPAEEREHYSGDTDAWVDYVCTHLMGRLKEALAPGGHLIQKRINDHGHLAPARAVQIPVTRREWLVGMTEGRDLLSAAAHPLTIPANTAIYRDGQGLGHRLRGLAGLGDRMESVGPPGAVVQAPIFEFRGYTTISLLTHSNWSDFARQVRRTCAMINNPAKSERELLSEPSVWG